LTYPLVWINVKNVSPPHHFYQTDERQKKKDTNYQPGWIYGA